MSAKEIREALRLAESRGKNLYMIRNATVETTPRRVIGARERKGIPEVLVLGGGWVQYAFRSHCFYEA